MENSVAPEIIIALVGLLTTIVSSAVTYAITTRQFGRSKLAITASNAEDLSKNLRMTNQSISILVNDRKIDRLNRAELSCTNVGNTSIEGIRIQVSLYEKRQYASIIDSYDNYEVTKSIKIIPNETSTGFDIEIPFLNSGESLSLNLYFSGGQPEYGVNCRMKGVNVILNRGPIITISEEIFESVLKSSSLFFPLNLMFESLKILRKYK